MIQELACFLLFLRFAPVPSIFQICASQALRGASPLEEGQQQPFSLFSRLRASEPSVNEVVATQKGRREYGNPENVDERLLGFEPR